MDRAKPGRTRIERALLALLTRKPLAQISITELCEAAGTSRSTFYANFSNVDNLYRSLVSELLCDASSLSARLRCEDDGGLPHARPLCAIIREPGEFAGLVGDERFLQTAIETCQTCFPEGSFSVYSGACPDPETAEALFLFQMTGCISAAKALGRSARWPSVQKSIDTFIRGGLAAVRRAGTSAALD